MIVILVIVIIVVRRKRKPQELVNENRSVVAFENPMYDNKKNLTGSAAATTGYEQVPAAEGEGEGLYDEPTTRAAAAAAAPTESPYNDFANQQAQNVEEPQQGNALEYNRTKTNTSYEENVLNAPGAFLSNNDFQDQDNIDQDGYLDVNATDDVTGFGNDESTAAGFSGEATEKSPEELLADAVENYDN